MTRASDLREIIAQYNAAETFAQLAELAAPHIGRSTFFELLDYNSKDPLSDIHDLTVVSLPPVPQSDLKLAKKILDAVYPNWRSVIAPAFTSRPDLLNELAHRLLYDERPYSLVLAHERIEDVAIIMAVLIVLLVEERGVPLSLVTSRFHIVFSNIVRMINVRLELDGQELSMPAARVLQLVCWVHFSFPRTDSMSKSKFADELVDDSNELLRLEIKSDPLACSAVAAPGSIDKVLNIAWLTRWLPGDWAKRHQSLHIQPVKGGTFKLVEGYVLAVAAVLSGETQFCEVSDLTMVQSLDQLHELMDWISERRWFRTKVPTFYHREMNSLTKMIRAARLGRLH